MIEQTTVFFTSADGPRQSARGDYYLVDDAAGERFLVGADLYPQVQQAIDTQSPLVCKISVTQKGKYTNRAVQEIKDYNNAPERPPQPPGEAVAPPVHHPTPTQQAPQRAPANDKDEAMYVMSCNRLLQGMQWSPGAFVEFLEAGGLTQLAKAATVAWRNRDPVNPPRQF